MTEAPQTDSGAPIPAGGPDPSSIAASIEAVLISRSRPISAEGLAKGLGLVTEQMEPPERKAVGEAVLAAVDALNEQYEATGRAFRIERVAGGLRVVTLTAFAAALEAFNTTESSSRLSRPAIETLAIIAYRQPVARAQIESIRGVACGEVLRSLLERRLIAVVGRAEELGRPMLYGTTKQFLQAFGLGSIQDLPEREERSPA